MQIATVLVSGGLVASPSVLRKSEEVRPWPPACPSRAASTHLYFNFNYFLTEALSSPRLHAHMYLMSFYSK